MRHKIHGIASLGGSDSTIGTRTFCHEQRSHSDDEEKGIHLSGVKRQLPHDGSSSQTALVGCRESQMLRAPMQSVARSSEGYAPAPQVISSEPSRHYEYTRGAKETLDA